jgi:hypothetical protein
LNFNESPVSGDLDFEELAAHLDQLAEVIRKIRQFLKVQPAEVQIGLHVLERVLGEHAVAPQEPVLEPGRQNPQGRPRAPAKWRRRPASSQSK